MMKIYKQRNGWFGAPDYCYLLLKEESGDTYYLNQDGTVEKTKIDIPEGNFEMYTKTGDWVQIFPPVIQNNNENRFALAKKVYNELGPAAKERAAIQSLMRQFKDDETFAAFAKEYEFNG